MSARPAVLVIAGSDSSGGAGLVRDVRALGAFGADALAVVTAVTAQSDQRVLAVHPIPPAVLRAQIEAACETRLPDAIKIGMLTNRETVEAVADALRVFACRDGGRRRIAGQPAPIVLDPVLVSSSGGMLLDEAGRRAMKERLFPIAALVTPNLPEAAALLDEASAGQDEPSAARDGAPPAGHEPPAESARSIGRALDELAHRLLELGPRAVLLKGGHSREGDVIDRLACRGEPLRRITSPRLRAAQRGTGCALASAIAAQLAAGVPLEDACRRAQHYVGEGLRAAAAL